MSFTLLPKPAVQVSLQQAFQRPTFRLQDYSCYGHFLSISSLHPQVTSELHRTRRLPFYKKDVDLKSVLPHVRISLALQVLRSPPTLISDIVGLLNFAFIDEPPTFMKMNSVS